MLDATQIAATNSTKIKLGWRGPERHSSRKGDHWHFGKKIHVCVDPAARLVHTVVTTHVLWHNSLVAPSRPRPNTSGTGSWPACVAAGHTFWVIRVPFDIRKMPYPIRCCC